MNAEMKRNKTALQIFEEIFGKRENPCCRNCARLITKETEKGYINFCENSGKIVLDRFLDGAKMRDCDYKPK